ncbi:putative rmlC-like cupin domain superfamily, rmlC-like jelly roll protein [Septoria linicola]|nr:putative rmlC-like cupin domain superfamily, rmlC-like jelly roll protein [Septoria linicola]
MPIRTCISLACFVACGWASLWVDQAPDYVRPYAIEHYANAQALTIGAQTYRFPITGAASGNKFSLLTTNAPASGDLGVLPHIHELHHENFFCLKGRFQLWAHKGNATDARLLTAGDYGSVPSGTTHTFQIVSPDTE